MKPYAKVLSLSAIAILTMFILGGIISQQAQASPRYVPTAGCVHLYEHENATGAVILECRKGTYSVGSLSWWNDRISSVYVGTGTSVLLYTEAGYKGACRYFTPGSYNSLRAFRIDWRKTWNDITSSYIINPSTIPSNCQR